MSDTFELKKLFLQLREDALRKQKPFSEETSHVHKVVHHPFASKGEKLLALSRWLQKFQPCVFGQIAAAKGNLQYCILDDQDLLGNSDQEIARTIHEHLLKWKRRSYRPTPEFSTVAHGFMLAVCSERVAKAAPDDRLYDFASKFLELWNCVRDEGPAGPVFSETLFLKNMKNSECRQFQFSVDFFAAQGDGRWWCDHRLPGGIAFTANSVGHMRWYKEWYQGAAKQEQWQLRTAMNTIDHAQEGPEGRANWLESLPENGMPVVDRLASPFGDETPGNLQGKDWTRYRGYFHTDVAIRKEFFNEAINMPEDVRGKTYLQEFSYRYDPQNKDFANFSHGVDISCEDVEKMIGSPEDFVEMDEPQVKEASRGAPGNPEVERLLEVTRAWRLSDDEVERLMH